MTVPTPPLLTLEEFASLLHLAFETPSATIPAIHLAKLAAHRYVAITPRGPVITGDGLLRITESNGATTNPT
jgi:hypothetical protein